MKKTYTFFILIMLLLFSLLSLAGCDSKDEESLLKEKLDSEILYLDNELLSMLNALNNITFTNYKVVVEDLTQGTENTESSSSESGGEGGNNSQEASQKIEKGTNAEPNLSSMVPSNILLDNRDNVDWVALKQNIETIYSTWSIILSDLYKIGVNNDDILNFSTDLEQAIISIRNEDKIASLINLSKLYSYIPIYLDQYSNDESYKNIEKTKVNVMNAYSLVEQDKWEDISRYLAEAEKHFTINLNNQAISENNTNNRINKTYTLLKEMQNCIELKDKDVFYIKYRTLIEELNSL